MELFVSGMISPRNVTSCTKAVMNVTCKMSLRNLYIKTDKSAGIVTSYWYPHARCRWL